MTVHNFVRVASVSGGKDSTAMLIILAEKGEHLDYIAYNNTGIEFPQMVQYVRKVLSPWAEEHFGIPVTEIRPKEPFALQVKKRGVPFAPAGRWCCRTLKKEPFWQWVQKMGFTHLEVFYGYSADEVNRFERAEATVMRTARKFGVEEVHARAPLIEEGITEREALELTKKAGLYNSLYDYFERTGCYLCPYQSIGDWRNLYWHFPRLFNAAKTLEEMSIKEHGKTFRRDYTLEELEDRFNREMRQTTLIKYNISVGDDRG